MNDEQFRELLADYLAGELDEQRAAELRAELEANAERRKLAHELQAAAAALEANTIRPEEAERRTGGLALAGVASAGAARESRRPLRRTRLQSALRYAAVIVLAFGAGFVVRGWRLESTPIARPSPPSTFPLNEHYVANFARATQAFPESPAFSRSLLMLARK